MPTPEEVIYGEALLAVKAGQRSRARDLLTRLIKTQPGNPEYWLWMSAVVATPKERVYCLKEALRLDPQNAAAQRGLILIGALPPNPELQLPAAAQKRAWQSQFGLPGDSVGQRAALSRRQWVMMGAGVLILLALVSFGLLSANSARRGLRPAYYLPSGTARPAETATAAPTVRVDGTAGPLALAFQRTYTPTPLYVNTPHSISEAFRIGQRAYMRGEWETARSYFEQVAVIDPQAADVRYNIAETYRQEGDLEAALEAYDAALKTDPDFAPAYLGRARALLAQDSTKLQDALSDLESAVEHDPNYGEAYLELAALQVEARDVSGALRTLEKAETRLPGSALVPLYRAQAYLAGGRVRDALENAQEAVRLDPALLLAYRVMGQAQQAAGDFAASIEPLTTYLYYTAGDAEAWAWLAEAQMAGGDRKAALAALEKSLKLDITQVDARMVRGQLLLENDRAEDALKDFEAVLRADDTSFEATMGSAQALIALRYPGDAYDQIERAKRLAVSETQKAEWTYWRARSLDALGETEVALRDYKSLAALPKGVVQADWLSFALKRIAALDKTTPTQAATRTKTPRPTATRSR